MKHQLFVFIVLIVFVVTASRAQNNYTETGKASYYGDEFNGKKTASGEIYNMNEFTAAHKTLPFGTKVKVTNLKNNKTVVVRINDRGPFKPGRIIDLSKAAAIEIDLIEFGVVDVRIETNPEENPIVPIVLKKGYYTAAFKKVHPKGYGIQVGSFKNQENALKNLNEISKKYNKPVYLYVTSNLNFKKYKIFIGEVKNKKLADALKKELKKDFPDCFNGKY